MVRPSRKLQLNLVCLAAFALIAWILAGSVSGSSADNLGGVSLRPSGAAKKHRKAPHFGYRTLKKGMAGKDVRILKGLAKSESYLKGSLNRAFDTPTKSAVKDFQKDVRIRPSGVATRRTSKKMIRSMRTSGASWYGPGLYGNGTACGRTLRPRTVGVAHKKLPCGSKVMIAYKGRYLITKVIDRGPYVHGRSWDLTYAAADALNFISAGAARVRYAVIHKNRK